MTAKLDEYNRKRNLKKPLSRRQNRRPRGGSSFVVQHHVARKDHYDLRLEWKGLVELGSAQGPSYDTRDKRLAIQVEEHPLEYRNFEGTIPKGEYGGGVVMLWDEGYWKPYADVNTGLREGNAQICTKGRRLKANGLGKDEKESGRDEG
jgi:bifunctional non-homologous end joining protein LigD